MELFSFSFFSIPAQGIIVILNGLPWKHIFQYYEEELYYKGWRKGGGKGTFWDAREMRNFGKSDG